jgi:MFS transporter, DHA2 family, multidrug resistance protein
VEDTPAIKREVAEARKKGFNLDLIGFLFIAATFGSLEVVMDKGQEDDWFSSNFIVTFSIIAVVGLISMIAWELWLTHKGSKPVLDLRLFANRNFAVSFGLMFVLGFTLYATTVLLPQLLQSLMGYTAELSGLAMSTGGVATILCMPIVGALISKMDGRYLIMFGFGCLALALYHMTGLDLQMSFGYAGQLRFFQSLGLAFLFVPINTLSYIGVGPGKNNDVSGLVNLARNIAGSCGTSFFTTLLARNEQVHQNFLVEQVYNGGAEWTIRYQALTQQALRGASSMPDAQRHALAQFYQTIQTQAGVLSYIDILQALALICACMVPLVLLMKKPPKGMRGSAH